LGKEKQKNRIKKQKKTGKKKKPTQPNLTAINQKRSYPKTKTTPQHRSAKTIKAIAKEFLSKNIAYQPK
jgi:hypothetical protein